MYEITKLLNIFTQNEYKHVYVNYFLLNILGKTLGNNNPWPR